MRRFDAVLVVWKLDRWGRSVADCIRSIQERVGLGVRFLATTQNLDTDESNPLSRFLLHILVAFGELEREMIRERVRAGIRTAPAHGTALGRPRRVFRRDEALRPRSQGVSWRMIAQVLDLPMSAVIRACHFVGFLKIKEAKRPGGSRMLCPCGKHLFLLNGPQKSGPNGASSMYTHSQPEK